MIGRTHIFTSYSATHYYKKITKRQLERKRRARINRCSEQVKDLMGKNQNELTASHLQLMKKPSQVKDEAHNFQLGFIQGAPEFSNFLLNFPGFDSHVEQQVVDHPPSVVGPLSIQVPNFRLILSPDEGVVDAHERCKKAGSSTGGLLMVADGKSHVASDGSVDKMWRPW